MVDPIPNLRPDVAETLALCAASPLRDIGPIHTIL